MPTHAGQPFPIFNRIVVVVTSALLLCGGLWASFDALRNNNVTAVGAFSALMAIVIGVFGLWFTLSWRDKTLDQVHDELEGSRFQAEIPASAMKFAFSIRQLAAAVYLDVEGDQIYFHNCLMPRRLTSRPLPFFSCRISEIKNAHRLVYRGETLSIVTEAGVATLPRHGDDYEMFRDAVLQAVPKGDPRYSADNPLIGIILLPGMLAGGACGVAAVPHHADGAMLLFAVLVGAITGAGGMVGIAKLAAKFGIAVVQPLALMTLGAVGGLVVTTFLPRGNGTLALATIGLFGVIGFTIGIARQAANRKSTRPPAGG